MHPEKKSLLQRLITLPGDLKNPEARSEAVRLLICLLCILVLISGSIYTVVWMENRSRILKESERYSQMYTPADPTASPEITAAPEATAAPTPGPTAIPTSAPTEAPLPQVADVPIASPDGGTLIYGLPTPPPVQESFAELLATNPETIGFLEVGSIISLPVVQRENDNEYYLTHTFMQEKSPEGALFLDGLNRLVPEDDCLLIYGHNMNNGTMFGNLRMYLNIDYVRSSRPITFDTLYENRTYVPFAAFNASMDPDSADYFDVRQFIFDDQGFELFTLKLQMRSEHDIPVNVRPGDKLLLLITCDYGEDDGRFILALRALRDGETTDSMASKLAQAK